MVVKKNDDEGFGIASLVLGIASIVFSWFFILGLVAGILAIIFAAKQRKIKHTGISTGGLVTGIVGTVFSFLYTLFLIVVIGILSSSSSLTGMVPFLT